MDGGNERRHTKEPETSLWRRFVAPKKIKLDSLATLGPILALKMVFRPQGMDRKVVAEFWLYPDGSRLLEISTKCAAADAFNVAAQLRAYVTNRGNDQ